MWVAEIAPGAETGEHSHPTPRFVYVIEGSVTVEFEGGSPRVFTAGEGFQETPGAEHTFRNASTTEAAKALWVCPDSVDTCTMPLGQGSPDHSLPSSPKAMRGRSPRVARS